MRYVTCDKTKAPYKEEEVWTMDALRKGIPPEGIYRYQCPNNPAAHLVRYVLLKRVGVHTLVRISPYDKEITPLHPSICTDSTPFVRTDEVLSLSIGVPEVRDV